MPDLARSEFRDFRLTNYAKSFGEVLEALPSLEERHRLVQDAGCQMRPTFPPATFLVPITLEQYEELGLELHVHHILARRKDKALIVEALRSVPAASCLDTLWLFASLLLWLEVCRQTSY